MQTGYEKFKTDILGLIHIDLNLYKERQMKRRIDALIAKHHHNSYDSYVSAMKRDKNLLDEFTTYLTINVSEFYRNPEQWKVLEESFLPELIEQSGGRLTIWSAACSSGDEPYSLVMLLSKYLPLSQIKIIATDLDLHILEKAKRGIYYDKYIAGLPNEFKTKYFHRQDNQTVILRDEIRQCVEFRRHDLLKDPYITNCDLIVCRNVMIYFTEEAKNQVYQKFHASLKSRGILFVGSTEQIVMANEFGFEPAKTFFYRKKENKLLGESAI